MRKLARGLRSREDEFGRQRMGTPTHTSVDKARKLAWGSYQRIEKLGLLPAYREEPANREDIDLVHENGGRTVAIAQR